MKALYQIQTDVLSKLVETHILINKALLNRAPTLRNVERRNSNLLSSYAILHAPRSLAPTP